MKIPEIVKAKPLHKTLPALAGADSAGRIRDAWRAFRAATVRRQRTKLDQIPAEVRPLLARQYRVGAAGFVAVGLVMGYSAATFAAGMPGFAVIVTGFSAAGCFLIAVLKMWQAAMIAHGRGMGFKEFLFCGAADE